MRKESQDLFTLPHTAPSVRRGPGSELWGPSPLSQQLFKDARPALELLLLCEPEACVYCTGACVYTTALGPGSTPLHWGLGLHHCTGACVYTTALGPVSTPLYHTYATALGLCLHQSSPTCQHRSTPNPGLTLPPVQLWCSHGAGLATVGDSH
ncbi:hypothetical protein WMY93_028334 [Mugilogobius chulae]|uniref:Uncharacterized protein n=1 Tax=Mugilogobius chulae TaxID=88201 RepID=A0AAW0MRL8_9GOBI